MAVVPESFSIRSYAAGMRGVDLGNCWPFDGEDRKEQQLPTMEVKRFRWWGNELEEARRAAADSDGLQPARIVSGGRAKQRVPKKRSIVELFAVAPPVAGGRSGGGGDDDLREGKGQGSVVEGEGSGRDKSGGANEPVAAASLNRRKTRGIEGETKTRKKSRANVKTKFRRNKKKIRVDECTAKKGKICIPKIPSQVKFTKFLRGSACKKYGKIPGNPVRKQKKSGKEKCVAKKQSFKPKDTSRLVGSREVEKALPVKSILRDRKKGLSVKNLSTQDDANCSDLLKLFCDSAKHVSFSGKDDILGHSRSCSPRVLPKLQNFYRILAAVSNSMKNDLSAVEKPPVENGSENCVSTCVSTDRIGPSSPPTEQPADEHLPAPPSACSDSGDSISNNVDRTSFAGSVDLNHVLKTFNGLGGMVYPCESQSGDTTGQISDQKEKPNSDSVHELQNSSMVSELDAGIVLPTPTGNVIPRSDASSSMISGVVPHIEQSAFCIVTSTETNGRPLFPSEDPNMTFRNQMPGVRHDFLPPSKNLNATLSTSSISSRSGEERVVFDRGSICHDKYDNVDFVGLPLNSQGELINLHASRKFSGMSSNKQHGTSSPNNYAYPDLFELGDSMNNVKMKVRYPDTAPYENNNSTLFPEPYYATPRNYGSSNHGAPFLHRAGRENLVCYKNRNLLYHNRNTSGISWKRYKETDQPRYLGNESSLFDENINATERPPMPPTMRLMGKNLTLGKRSEDCDALRGGRPRMDKEIIAEQHAEVKISDKPLSAQQEWFLQSPSMAQKDGMKHSLGTPPGFDYMLSRKPESTHLLDRQQWMLRNSSTLSATRGPALNSFASSIPTQAFFEKPSGSTVICDSCHLGTRPEQVVPHPQNVYNHVLFNANRKYGQGISYNSTLTLCPPFPQDNGQFAPPSFAHSASNPSQWLLTVSQQNYPQSSPQLPSSSNADQMYATPGNNLLHVSSPWHVPSIPLPVYDAGASETSGSFTICSARHPFTSDFTTGKPSASVNDAFRSIDGKRRNSAVGPQYTYLTEQDVDHRARKRPAAEDRELPRAMKRTSYVVLDDDSADEAASSKGKQPLVAPAFVAGSLKGVYHGGAANNLGSLVMSNEHDGPGDTSRSGFLKLAAGAKHVLMPLSSRNIEQGNIQLTHSTIPFSDGEGPGKLIPGAHKTAEIYRF